MDSISNVQGKDGSEAGRMPALRREGKGKERGEETVSRERGAVRFMPDVPLLGKADLGESPWERKLVARIREVVGQTGGGGVPRVQG